MRFKRTLLARMAFNPYEQAAIISLLFLVTVLMYIFYFHQPKKTSSFSISSPEMKLLHKEIDSLQSIALEKRKPKLYPFNPNFITDYKGYRLRMTNKQIDALHNFRDKGQWINSVSQFKLVTGVDQQWLDSIAPYFKFPNWVTHPQKKKVVPSKNRLYNQKWDLNQVTAIQLQEVYGVGSTLSERIVAYRDKLGGFAADQQLYGVYGLHEKVVQNILQQATVKTPVVIQRYSINKASASDIATIPGISFELAKEIWEFVKLREGIASISELKKIERLSEGKIALIELYLYVD